MPSEYRFKRRVSFSETDMAGVVHFSCFFRYMGEAEHAFWRAAGLSIAPKDSAVGFPRVAAACEFRLPLRFEDEFEVWLRVTAITNRTIRYACTLTRAGEHIAEGTMAVVSVRQEPGGRMVPVALPDDVVRAFQVHRDAAS